MTPKVRDILIAARRDVHAAMALHANICDTQALFTLDNLITADACRSVNEPVAQADVVADLEGSDDESTRPTEKLPARPERAQGARPDCQRDALALSAEERNELERLRKADASSTRIINGLLDKLKHQENRQS